MTTPPTFGTPLLDAVREIERHAAQGGWDVSPRLFALADTADLAAREPALAAQLGIDPATASGLTPVEQEDLAADRPLDELLATVAWPADVAGCAVVLERLVLPPSAEDGLPEDAGSLARIAAEHEGRQDVRLVVAVLRDGTRECAVRLRSHDTEAEVLTGPDLVPALCDALLATLED